MTDYILDLTNSDYDPATFDRGPIEDTIAKLPYSPTPYRVIVEHCELCRHGWLSTGVKCPHCFGACNIAWVEDYYGG